MESVPLDQILTLLPDDIRLHRRASLSTIRSASSSAYIRRLTLRGESDSLNLVVKRVLRTEWATHSLLNEELPRVVPQLHGAGEIGANDWCLVMEDLSLQTGTMNLTGMRAALRSLAEVHRRFANRRRELPAEGPATAGTTAAEVGRQLGQALEVLIGIAPLLEMEIDEYKMKIAREVAQCLASETAHLTQDRRHALVHGDFHFGNIFQFSETEVRIGDWGSAALQVPAWDLIMCSEQEVAYYLAHADHAEGFCDDLRAAVLYRMAEFITTGVMFLLTPAGALADTLPLCFDRFIEAATTADFRGGSGVRFPNDLSERRDIVTC